MKHPGAGQAAGRLAGKVVLVTGAGSVGPGWGNGRAIAVRFAAEGARIVGLDRDLQRMQETRSLIAQAGGEFTALACDVTSSAAVQDAVAQGATVIMVAGGDGTLREVIQAVPQRKAIVGIDI